MYPVTGLCCPRLVWCGWVFTTVNSQFVHVSYNLATVSLLLLLLLLFLLLLLLLLLLFLLLLILYFSSSFSSSSSSSSSSFSSLLLFFLLLLFLFLLFLLFLLLLLHLPGFYTEGGEPWDFPPPPDMLSPPLKYFKELIFFNCITKESLHWNF